MRLLTVSEEFIRSVEKECMKQNESVMQSLGGSTSLRTQPGEVREVQFVVERECPHQGDTPTNLTSYPAPIFVEWPPVAEPEVACEEFIPCGSHRYYWLPNWQARRLGLLSSEYWLVCEHMGHLIE